MSDIKTVCVIEDNLPIRKLFTTLLKKNGFNVIDFDNAKPGIDWLKNNKPDIILLDILLPELSGLDAIKIIREMQGFENLPVVAVTGFAGEVDQEKYLNAGFSYYITKPVNVSTFASDIRNYIND